MDEEGLMPVQEYLFAGKGEKDLSVLINVIQRLAHVGQDLLDTNMAKHIDDPIYELRKDHHRILYAQDGDRFVLLSAFLKQTQKTPVKEIRLAEKWFNQYLEKKGYFELHFPE